MSLRAMRQVARLMPTAGRLPIEQDVLSTTSAIEALAVAAVEVAIPVIPAPSPYRAIDVVREVAPATAEVVVSATQAGSEWLVLLWFRLPPLRLLY